MKKVVKVEGGYQFAQDVNGQWMTNGRIYTTAEAIRYMIDDFDEMVEAVIKYENRPLSDQDGPWLGE